MSATRVLVVDDEPALAEIVRGYLAAEGMDVAVAGDGLTAVDEVRERRPDVVVLDVMLPGLDGFEVLRQLRSFATGPSVAGRATVGGVAAFLAIGCPVCNKIVVAALGVSGALTVFAPLQPVIGGASLALLGATLVWRLRDRARRCERCVA